MEAAADRVSTADCALAYGPNRDGRCEWDGQPIPARRDGHRFCSDACQAAFVEAHHWPAARAGALRRAARRCRTCRTRNRVQVHHDPPVPLDDGYGDGCQHHPDRLAVLCSGCHAHEHRNLRAKPGSQLALFRAA